MSIRNKLLAYCRACYPCIGIETTEEQLAMADVLYVAEKTGKSVVSWTATSGARMVSPRLQEFSDTSYPTALAQIRERNAIYVLFDYPGLPWEIDPVLTRSFRELLNWAPSEGSMVVVVTPKVTTHPTITNSMVIIDYQLPDEDALKKIVEEICSSAGIEIPMDIYTVISALSGLSTAEASNALALSFAEKGKIDTQILFREKVLAVKKSGLLEIIETDKVGLDGIGGLQNIKNWIRIRSRGFSREAKEYGLNFPKGILITGVPGTGKSLASKAVGRILGFPTLRMDMGAMFNSLVGESERTIRNALALADAMAPCVVWIDEIDKGLSGSSGSGSSDSGVSRRVFGTIVSWMQERDRPVFLVATANDVTALPSEFLRKGRWDEMFAVDIPTLEERMQIAQIHLQKRNRTWDATHITLIAEATDGFTGAEIEAVIVDAMYSAFDEDREVTIEDVLVSARKTIPLSVTAKEKIDDIRKWAKGRAVMAGITENINSNPTTSAATRRFAN